MKKQPITRSKTRKGPGRPKGSGEGPYFKKGQIVRNIKTNKKVLVVESGAYDQRVKKTSYLIALASTGRLLGIAYRDELAQLPQ